MDPNLPYFLVVLGLAGICFEFCAPGTIIPGAAGGVLLVVGLYNLNRVTGIGLAMICVAIAGIAALLGIAARARANKIIDLRDEIGVAQTALNPNGKVRAAGKIWDAQSRVPIPQGASVIVKSVQGLSLEVIPR